MIDDILPDGWREMVFEDRWRKQTGIVYLILLEQGKYYVGWTRHLVERMKQHWAGKGAGWTKLYQPIRVLMIRHGTVKTERMIAAACRQRWGEAHVRGGPWTAV